jgi:hypothetical protein
MPVYLFTFHAYLSWLPDRRQGYVEKGRGVLPQDLDRARLYREIAAHEPVTFDPSTGWAMMNEAGALCDQQPWRLHEAVATTTHVHVLVSWRSPEKWQEVATRFKQRLGAAISRHQNRPGPWFSRGRSRKHVRDRKHLDYLMNTYLPRHGQVRYSLRHERSQDGA